MEDHYTRGLKMLAAVSSMMHAGTGLCHSTELMHRMRWVGGMYSGTHGRPVWCRRGGKHLACIEL